MDTGELLVRWTARLAVALFFVTLALRARLRNSSARWVWTAGCLVYLLHVFCAFQFVHNWRHADAYAATVRQTTEVARLEWGGGLWVNYVFTIVWMGDTVWWWLAAKSYAARAAWLTALIYGFMGFIVFNASVVFASGISRWIGALGCVLLVVVPLTRYKSARPK